MPATVHADTMLIQEGVLLPTSLRLQSDSYVSGWRVLKEFNSYSLDRRVRAFGWHLFYRAEEVKAIVYGRGEERDVRRAVNRIVAKARPLNFNCIGLTKIVTEHFLGIPYLTISGHPHHLQESGVLQSAAERRDAQKSASAKLPAELGESTRAMPGSSLRSWWAVAGGALCLWMRAARRKLVNDM
jgi:hypothetical protein